MRYKLLDKLGEGGMGVVYRALHPELNREVAIKFLLAGPEDLTADGSARFKREMQVLISLSHPSIVALLDAGEADGRLYYAMELLEAKDLERTMKERGPLPVRLVLDVLEQVLDALDYLHGRGLVHRDIKPANIMLERSGRAVLMDFGLVRKEDATLLTAQGKVLGTPRYLPPEGIRGGGLGPPGDLWSLGVTAFELLTGERAFAGATLAELAAAILNADPGPVTRRLPDLPPALDALIARFLEKDPARRWTSAKEALGAVRSLAGASSGELALPVPALPPAAPPLQARRTRRTRPVVPVAPVAPPGPSPSAPRRTAFVAAAAAALALAAAAVGLRPRAPAPPPPSASILPSRQKPTTAERIAQLARAVRTVRLTEADTDAAWRRLRKDIPNWSMITSGRPSQAARAIKERPEITRPLDELVARVRAAPGLTGALESLRPEVPRILSDAACPPEVAADLLDALGRLEFVDSLADYVTVPPPFRVRAMLAPAFETRADLASIERLRVESIYPGVKAGAAVFHPKQYGKGFSTADFTLLAVTEPATMGREPASAARFTVPPLPPSTAGFALHIRTQRFVPQTYMYMTPPGLRAALPARQPPGHYQGASKRFWFTVVVRGPLLARAGEWTVEHRRTFEDGSPMAFSVDEVVLQLR